MLDAPEKVSYVCSFDQIIHVGSQASGCLQLLRNFDIGELVGHANGKSYHFLLNREGTRQLFSAFGP